MMQQTSDNPKSRPDKRPVAAAPNPAIEALRQWLERHGHRARRAAPRLAAGR